MDKQKILAIIASALMATSIGSTIAAFESANNYFEEKEQLVSSEVENPEAELEMFKNDLKAAAKQQHADGLIDEKELSGFIYTVNELTLRDFLTNPQASPLSDSARYQYEVLSAEQTTDTFLWYSAAIGSFASAFFALGIALVDKQERLSYKDSNQDLKISEIAMKKVMEVKETPYFHEPQL